MTSKSNTKYNAESVWTTISGLVYTTSNVGMSALGFTAFVLLSTVSWFCMFVSPVAVFLSGYLRNGVRCTGHVICNIVLCFVLLATFGLLVHTLPIAPLAHVRQVNTSEGETVIFDCKSSGDPTPSVTFFKNGVEMKGPRPGENWVIDGSKLTIYDVKQGVNGLGDNAVYRCKVKNEHGYLWTSFQLNLIAYTANPLVERVPRPVTTLSGGIQLDVHGRGLDLLQRARMLVTHEGALYWGARCEGVDEHLMVCRTPPLDALALDRRAVSLERPLRLDYGFDLDGTLTGNLTLERAFPKLAVFPDARLYALPELLNIRPGGDLVLKGELLNAAASARDVRVTVGGLPCNVSALSASTLTCLLPAHLDEAHNDAVDVLVYVGDKMEKVGEASQRTRSQDSSMWWLWLLVILILFIVIVLIAYSVMRRRRPVDAETEMTAHFKRIVDDGEVFKIE